MLNDDQNIQVATRQTQSTIGSKHVSLGSPSPSITIAKIEQWHVDDLSFTNFRKKIRKAFSNYFNEIIKFNSVDQVCRQRFLDYNYLIISCFYFLLVDHPIQAPESQLQ